MVRDFVVFAALCALASASAATSDIGSTSGSVVVELDCAVSDADKDFGIQALADQTCAAGGLGCYNDHCRFCKVLDTLKSAHFLGCNTSNEVPTPISTTPAPASPSVVFECNRTASSADKEVGLDIVSDSTCSVGGVGCVDSFCRFCQQFETAQSETYINCSSIVSANVSALASTSTGGSLESTSASVCTTTVSSGDAAVGINIVTDTSCSAGGVGCIDSVCRYCKTTDTPQSSHLNTCPTISAATAAPTASAPTTASKLCTATVSDGDAAVGIGIITDASCDSGGLGCIDSVCRYCKTKSTDQSAHLGSCSDYSSTSTTSPTSIPTVTTTPAVTTSAPATTSPAVTTSAPATATASGTTTYSIPLDCYQTVSSGDKSVGLDILTDIRCGDGGVGCVDSVCRFCKRFDTTQSQSYMSCSDIPPADTGDDINFVAISLVVDEI